MSSSKAILTELEAAEYLGIHQTTLRKGRTRNKAASLGQSLPFVKMGRSVQYLKKDLDQWLEEHRVKRGGK